MRTSAIRVARLLVVTALTGMSVHAAAARVELTFEVVYGNMRLGEGREVLEYGDGRYSVVSVTEPEGLAALFINDIRRESKGVITASGLRPERFEESGRKEGARYATFDWSEKKLTMSSGGSTQTVALPPETFDQASLPYGFMFTSPADQPFLIHVTDGRRVQQYRYRLVAREKIKTKMGEMETLHYEKVRDADDKRGFEFWIALGHKNLPVKLRYSDRNNRVFESVITSIKAE
jgi:hypothetical protein